MILHAAVDQYVAWQRSHGARFETSACLLRQFCKSLPDRTRCDAVREADVRRFLGGVGPLTRTRANKYGALAGFYRYAISRGHAARSPLPSAEEEPRQPPSVPPYIYSREELERLFAAIEGCFRHANRLDGDTFRTLLLILYGAGLRIGEAVRLAMHDVNPADALLTVRNAKFYKDRLVPVAPHLADALRAYAVRRSERPLPAGMDSTFLAYRDGTPVFRSTAAQAFSRLLARAGIGRCDDGRRAPCLHSLRHSAAVHRVTTWYREGADVQRLLPALSTWLGHTNLEGTKVYLSMTSELLQEASVRFDCYVNGGDHE